MWAEATRTSESSQKLLESRQSAVLSSSSWPKLCLCLSAAVLHPAVGIRPLLLFTPPVTPTPFHHLHSFRHTHVHTLWWTVVITLVSTRTLLCSASISWRCESQSGWSHREDGECGERMTVEDRGRRANTVWGLLEDLRGSSWSVKSWQRLHLHHVGVCCHTNKDWLKQLFLAFNHQMWLFIIKQGSTMLVYSFTAEIKWRSDHFDQQTVGFVSDWCYYDLKWWLMGKWYIIIITESTYRCHIYIR